MDEFSFIDSIKQKEYSQRSLVMGVGDDAAVFRPTGDVVAAVDTFVDGVHFSEETMSFYHAGYRALAANVSDLAAMGAVPAFYLVSIVIPKGTEEDRLTDLYRGMRDMAAPYKMDLIGGDTVSGKELIISITVIGYAEKAKARYRNTAKPGDVLFVTGTLGDSQAGLHILQHPGDYQNRPYFIKRHRMPEPRVEFSSCLGGIGRVTLNDVSDGISSEANEIAVASNVTISIDEALLPASEAMEQFPSSLQKKWKLSGGEDFELLGTVPEEDWEAVVLAAEDSGTKVTRIGKVEKHDGKCHVYIQDGQRRIPLEKKGYIHLK